MGLPVVGLYKYPGTYKTTIRFANAEGKIQSDWEKDVRSISVKVELPESLAVEAGAETQDYSMNNTPEFSIDSVEEFANLFTREKIGLFVKTIARGLKDKRRWDGEKFTELTFYSGTAYALGSEHVSKIAFKPCKQNFSDTAKLSKSNPNAFMDHVSSITKDKKACFGLWLQILNPQKIPQGFFSKSTAADYVEHSAKSWGEEESIWVKVGQLDFIDNKQISSSACESLRFNINRNTFRDQRGIGNINRARTQAEKASAERR
ncbi:MAG: hypothetical protein M9962_00790 [Oligoflexia bacterium]|nr:hypothetical protein [Oligoflexia bacterium]